MTIYACLVVVNHSALITSRRRVPLKRSFYPFSQGELGYIRIGFTYPCQPVLHRLCDELQSIIGVNVFRGAVAQEPRVQRLRHIVSPHPGTNRHSQRLPRVLIQDGPHLVL